ncbi:hypothetical protein B5F76_00365 [Desulfovibrio sp. An276]|nr:hypothetical protein B5F76_00365 [Desulfovibrio sp. An276]
MNFAYAPGQLDNPEMTPIFLVELRCLCAPSPDFCPSGRPAKKAASILLVLTKKTLNTPLLSSLVFYFFTRLFLYIHAIA